MDVDDGTVFFPLVLKK